MTERRVILHAGFHKTGTTAFQTFLRDNAGVLRRHMLTAQNFHLRDLIHSLRAFAMFRDPVSAAMIGEKLAAHLAGLEWKDRRVLLISVEEMAGRLPGLPSRRQRPDIAGFDAAPALMGVLADSLRHALGAQTEIAAFYGTREPESWLRSVYWQHVKAARMEMDLDTFMAVHRPAADLDSVVAAVAAGNRLVQVTSARVEPLRDLPFGVATPLLDLAGVPGWIRDKCQPIRQVNVAPPATMLTEMLALNRAGLDDATLKVRKKALEDAARGAAA